MSLKSKIQIKQIPAESFVNASQSFDGIAVRWLGQAGFQIFYKDKQFLIDPYLSDFLAKKYAGKEFPHLRMIPSPLEYSKIAKLNWTLCTHCHSDHMDPEALPVILENNPDCKVLAPEAEKEHIEKIGINEKQIIYVTAGKRVDLANDIAVEVLASAHEELKLDEKGNHYYLGYILKIGDVTIYHSGDCIPYDSLEQKLQKQHIDIAFLPVNGRGGYRKNRGILGNFTCSEALELCENANIPLLICHHFGMFDFNTVSQQELNEQFTQNTTAVRPYVLEPKYMYCLV